MSNTFYNTSKRLFDILLASFLLLILAPVILIVSVLIYISMGRPIIFKQKRPGFKGEIFSFYKFRTMSFAKDNNNKLAKDESRVTKMGLILRKLSLDELPQIINVLKGDISFVGPRPLLEEYLPLYSNEQARRHDVKPGITGWAQVNGRNNISWDKKFKLDVWYVDNRSIALDIKILFMTFTKVLGCSDIGSGGSSFVDKFNGSN